MIPSKTVNARNARNDDYMDINYSGYIAGTIQEPDYSLEGVTVI